MDMAHTRGRRPLAAQNGLASRRTQPQRRAKKLFMKPSPKPKHAPYQRKRYVKKDKRIDKK